MLIDRLSQMTMNFRNETNVLNFYWQCYFPFEMFTKHLFQNKLYELRLQLSINIPKILYYFCLPEFCIVRNNTNYNFNSIIACITCKNMLIMDAALVILWLIINQRFIARLHASYCGTKQLRFFRGYITVSFHHV